jgi:hypothetical protein
MNNPQITTLGRRSAPPFKPGDRVVWRPHPDGVETCIDVMPCWETGRHRMITKRQLGELVHATRVGRTCHFAFARTPADTPAGGWRRRAAGPPRLLALAGLACGSWLLLAVVGLAGFVVFRHG